MPRMMFTAERLIIMGNSWWPPYVTHVSWLLYFFKVLQQLVFPSSLLWPAFPARPAHQYHHQSHFLSVVYFLSIFAWFVFCVCVCSHVWATVNSYSTNVRVCLSYCESLFSACGSAQMTATPGQTVATNFTVRRKRCANQKKKKNFIFLLVVCAWVLLSSFLACVGCVCSKHKRRMLCRKER